MTHPIDEPLGNPITEDDIAHYLSNTPDFFQRHSELLAAVCTGLGLSLSEVLELVRDRVERVETFAAPVALPIAPAVDADQVSASAA